MKLLLDSCWIDLAKVMKPFMATNHRKVDLPNQRQFGWNGARCSFRLTENPPHRCGGALFEEFIGSAEVFSNPRSHCFFDELQATNDKLSVEQTTAMRQAASRLKGEFTNL
ncbi:MAG: hypothetical protein KJ070_24530 [Verrucomicrobia bacterium]|nr:hypothetical protein [Verrucomicrobiota bacterium]